MKPPPLVAFPSQARIDRKGDVEVASIVGPGPGYAVWGVYDTRRQVWPYRYRHTAVMRLHDTLAGGLSSGVCVMD